LGFGLIHGYGFAGLLTEAAAPSALLGWALFGFNLGVEAGQLLAVLLWVAVSQLFVRQAWYGSVVVRGGSIALFALAACWVWERVFTCPIKKLRSPLRSCAACYQIYSELKCD
jgi:uncharacterized membrane protein